MNKCKICNKKFIKNYHFRKCCSVKCSKENIRQIRRKYKITHRKEVLEQGRRYMANLREKDSIVLNNRTKKWRKTHKIEINNYSRIYRSNKMKTDINYRLAANLRSQISRVLVNDSKSEITMNLVGCSIEFLKEHLQKQFKPGMSWSNYGKWHIDHIRPCCSFDLSKPEEQRKCFHYSNLQPLWAVDNLIKGRKNG